MTIQGDNQQALPLNPATPLSPAQIEQALARREKVRRLIGVMDRGMNPPTREEFQKQLARQVATPND